MRRGVLKLLKVSEVLVSLIWFFISLMLGILLVFLPLQISSKPSLGSLISCDHFLRNGGPLNSWKVNNAGMGGTVVTDPDSLRSRIAAEQAGGKVNWEEIMIEPFKLDEECLKINYYGPKRMIEAFTPLLQLSDLLRIVNVSSSMGKLQNIKNEWAKAVLSDAENLTEERVDEVLNQLLKDFKEGLLEAKSLPSLSLCLNSLESSLECLHKDSGQQVSDSLHQLCVSWLCPNRYELQQWHLHC